MTTKGTSGASFNKLVSDIGDVVTDVRDLYRDHGRQTAEDVVTLTAFSGIVRRNVRRAYLWAAAPVVRLEQRLAAIEYATLHSNPGPAAHALARPPFQVRTRPTVGGQFQIDVEGVLPSDAELVFIQNGVERHGRLTRFNAHSLRGELPLADVGPGTLDILLKHGGGLETLTSVDVHPH
jgi:hypothetical protein